MFSDLYDIYIKGDQYAAELDMRLCWMNAEQVEFIGNNNIHILTHKDGAWTCDCYTFQMRFQAGLSHLCAHVRAVEIGNPILVYWPARNSSLDSSFTEQVCETG